jgi:prepilin peptidase CpaA
MTEIVHLGLPILAGLLACVFDLRSREIPDWIPLGVLVLVPLDVYVGGSDLLWWHRFAGGLLALGIGLLVGYGDRFGGGDVKLFGALGAWFGVAAVIPLALWTAIAGLPLAVIAAVRKQQDFAYAPAIFIGVCVHVFAPNLLLQIAGR